MSAGFSFKCFSFVVLGAMERATYLQPHPFLCSSSGKRGGGRGAAGPTGTLSHRCHHNAQYLTHTHTLVCVRLQCDAVQAEVVAHEGGRPGSSLWKECVAPVCLL